MSIEDWSASKINGLVVYHRKFESRMSEVLSISITPDARTLFIEHDVQTIKKIKQTALKEIDDKQEVLRKFIGSNYRPLLTTPPVLLQIKSISDEAQSILAQVDAIGRNLSSALSVPRADEMHPFSAASQLYLRSLQKLDAKEFKSSLDFALEASALLRENRGPMAPTFTAMSQAVGSLPGRILSAVGRFLTDSSTALTSESLIDSFSTAETLFTNFPSFSTIESRTPAAYLQNFLIERVGLLVRSGDQVNDLCLSFLSLIEAIVAFLVAAKSVELSRLLDSVISKFCTSFQDQLPKFANLELRDILRVAKSISDALRARTALPRFVAAVRELRLTINFWNVAFLTVFGDLAAQSIQTSIAGLELPTVVQKILEDSNLAKFNGFFRVIKLHSTTHDKI
jgi:hypothetical protein